jgi:hypothetical protein
MREEKSLKEVLRRLSDLSVERAYDPYTRFAWPPTVQGNGLWMSRDLLSISGTEWMDTLSESQLNALSRWELVNFFSFNVHGIRDLMLHVLTRIHNSGFEETSEYFHHFLDEENKHMWFFAEFCLRYGGKVYVTQKLQFPSFEQEDIQNFVAFAKILISEQISDFYNVRMMGDESLPEIVREVNRVHHEDESRHIAMGLRVVRSLYEQIAEKYPNQVRRKIESYLRRYMQFFVQSFYNPSAYRDAGFDEPYEWRKNMIAHPGRRDFHRQVLSNTAHFLRSREVILEEVF